MIIADKLTLGYGKKTVIREASFHIAKGQAAVLVGENGSGKSTLLSAMAGAARPKKGTLQVNGRIAYIPQGSGLMEELTFADNLRFFASLAKTDIPHELPFGAAQLLDLRIKDMSGGMKKLCSIVCAVIGNPEMLLLDEPCASLDRAHKQLLIDYLCQLKKRGVTLVYVGHNGREYAAFADLYLCVENGVRVMTAQQYLCAQTEVDLF